MTDESSLSIKSFKCNLSNQKIRFSQDILSAHELHEFKTDFMHVNVASKNIHPVSVYT